MGQKMAKIQKIHCHHFSGSKLPQKMLRFHTMFGTRDINVRLFGVKIGIFWVQIPAEPNFLQLSQWL